MRFAASSGLRYIRQARPGGRATRRESRRHREGLNQEGGALSRGRQQQTALDLARDELFSHIQRCGVLDAEDSERTEWMSDTVGYLSERYPALSDEEVKELEAIGHRYCQPAIPFGSSEADSPAVTD